MNETIKIANTQTADVAVQPAASAVGIGATITGTQGAATTRFPWLLTPESTRLLNIHHGQLYAEINCACCRGLLVMPLIPTVTDYTKILIIGDREASIRMRYRDLNHFMENEYLRKPVLSTFATGLLMYFASKMPRNRMPKDILQAVDRLLNDGEIHSPIEPIFDGLIARLKIIASVAPCIGRFVEQYEIVLDQYRRKVLHKRSTFTHPGSGEADLLVLMLF
jgi:hypothetical protein